MTQDIRLINLDLNQIVVIEQNQENLASVASSMDFTSIGVMIYLHYQAKNREVTIGELAKKGIETGLTSIGFESIIEGLRDAGCIKIIDPARP